MRDHVIGKFKSVLNSRAVEPANHQCDQSANHRRLTGNVRFEMNSPIIDCNPKVHRCLTLLNATRF